MKAYQKKLIAFLSAFCMILPCTEISADAETLSGFTASQNLTYQNDMTFSEGDLKLAGYEITVNGDFFLTGGTVALGGGILHIKGDLIQSGGMLDVGGGILIIDGSYRIEGERSGENSSGCLDMNQADTVKIGKDFIMRTTGSNIMLKYSLAKSAEMTIGGDLYVYADGDCQGFCPNAKIAVNFIGSRKHEIFFDNDESYLSNIGISCGGTLDFQNFSGGISSDSQIAEISGTVIRAIAEGSGNLIFNHELDAVLNVSEVQTLPETNPIRQDISGDLNQDEKINIFDMLLLKKYLNHMIILSEQALKNADVNQNGSPDTDDMKQIQNFLHGKITAFQEQSENHIRFDHQNFKFYDQDFLVYFNLENSVPESSLTAYVTFAQAEHNYQGTLFMYLAEVNLTGLSNGQGFNWKLPVLPMGDYEIRLYDENSRTELDAVEFSVTSGNSEILQCDDYEIRLHAGAGELLASWDKEILLRIDTDGTVPEDAVILLCPEETPENPDFSALSDQTIALSMIKNNFMGCFSFPVPKQKGNYQIRIYDSAQKNSDQLIIMNIQIK